MLWADQYNLADLHDFCFKSLNTAADMKKLDSPEVYEKLSDATKNAPLKKLFELIMIMHKLF